MRYLHLFGLGLILTLPVVAFAQSDVAFVPLTSIPGIDQAGNAATLSIFLNNVYKLAIGAAAILAVIQIIRAGIMYMGGDSVFEKKEAKELITLAIGGLVLVLSPVIVFSIINPKILDLQIGGLDALQTKQQVSATSGSGLVTDITPGDSTSACKAKGGTTALFCGSDKEHATLPVPATGTCPAGSSLYTSCGVPAKTTGSSCDLYTNFTPAAVVSDETCAQSASNVDTAVDPACCKSLPVGATCCAKKK